MSDVRVVALTGEYRGAHAAYVESHPDATFVDLASWGDVVEQAYGIRQMTFLALEDGRVTGTLALARSTNRLFPQYLASAPFANQGGFYADTPATFSALLERAQDLHDEEGVAYTLIRRLCDGAPPPEPWVPDPAYATYSLELEDDPDRFYAERLRSLVRNRIKKARSHDMSVRFGGRDLLDDYWGVMNRAIRDLGSPYHSRRYLELILATDAGLAVLYDRRGRPIGGSLLVHHPLAVSQLQVACLHDSWHAYANDFLYWSVIAECCRRGLPRLDLGRSLVDSGNERFKMKWRPERRLIDNWYLLSQGGDLPHLNQANPAFDRARALWRRLPLPVAKLLGPRVMSGIL